MVVYQSYLILINSCVLLLDLGDVLCAMWCCRLAAIAVWPLESAAAVYLLQPDAFVNWTLSMAYFL
jgi:hypothetical protein